MTRKLTAILAVLISAIAITSAEARTRHQYQAAPVESVFDRHALEGGGGSVLTGTGTIKIERVRNNRERLMTPRDPRPVGAVEEVERQVVAHPAGCPHVRFCGCGVSLYLLGKVVTRGGLAIAANWLKLPEAAPGPRMAAARHGHVFAIIRMLSPTVALAYDPNGGRHQTYIRAQSIVGYKIVNPHGAQLAAAQ